MMKFFRAKENSSDASPQSVSPSPPSSASASAVTGPARPIRLVYCDEKGKFRMDPEAVAALQLVKGPIGVVSVCGRARQGKSFILNQVRNSLHFALVLLNLGLAGDWFCLFRSPVWFRVLWFWNFSRNVVFVEFCWLLGFEGFFFWLRSN